MRVLLIFAAALGFTCSLQAQTKAEVQDKYTAAAELYKAKNYSEAIPLFEETLTMCETAEDDVESIQKSTAKLAADAYLRAGATAAKNKQFEQAIDFLSKSSDVAGAENYMTRNRAEGMISKVYEVMGNTLISENEDYAGAAALYMQGIERNKRNTDLMTLAGQCYAKSGDMAKAEELYKQVIDLGASNSKYAPAAAKAKDAYATDMLSTSIEDAKNGKYDEVKATVDKVFEIAPGNGTAYMILLQAANVAKKYDDIVSISADAIAAQSDAEGKSNASMIVGAAYQNKGDKAKAIAAYQAVTVGPNVAAAKGAVAELSK